jgi:hypothetical protein
MSTENLCSTRGYLLSRTITVPEAAEKLDVTRQRILQMIRFGNLVPVKREPFPGGQGRYRISLDDIRRIRRKQLQRRRRAERNG